ncbi:carbamoyltransferase [bacterium]|nr:carbamoyltransferase [bacterium]
MITLGINSAYHESSADTADVLPKAAIRFCLTQAGIRADQIDQVAFSFDLDIRRSVFQPDPTAVQGQWGTANGEAVFQAGLARVPQDLSEWLEIDLNNRFVSVPHHIAHAASSFYLSGEREAAILVVDGIAESASTLLAHGRNGAIHPLEEFNYPHSLGFLWEKMSTFLGFSEYDACKVMGMAAYGDASVYERQFLSFVTVSDDGFSINPEIALFRQPGFEPLEVLFGPKRNPGDSITAREYNIAAALQMLTNRVLLVLLNKLHRLVPGPAVCLAGGVALNCAANSYLARHSPFKRIYIPTAPHDSGTAIGAALIAVERQRPVQFHHDNQSPYLGPEYSNDEISATLMESEYEVTRIQDKEKLAATWIAEGHIVAWFQGRMEFGPRALGNRSLLADPRNREVREIMNRKVKHRELFRPFGPSVLAAHAAEWFEIDGASESYKYMLFTPAARPEKAPKIPAVIHEDGTSRIQLVSSEINPTYHRLIHHFFNLTGVPMVLNTSFNDSEPIVCSPQDALATFQQTTIDALIIGDFAVTRPHLHISSEFIAQGEAIVR